MRYDISFDESLFLTTAEFAAQSLARHTAVSIGVVLSLDQFGALVTRWNALDHLDRSARAQYCQDHKHRYVRGPWPQHRVCQRCLVSYEVDG